MYNGSEPSPKGLGYCAHAEKLYNVMEGLDENEWYVSKVGDSKRWKLLKIPSQWFKKFEKLNKQVKLDTSNNYLKTYQKELKETIIKKIVKGKEYGDIIIYHTATWAVYGNKKFEKAIYDITKIKFSFSEQGLQNNIVRHY